MSKRRSFFIKHSLFSLLLLFVAVGMILFLWYPTPLAHAMGIRNLFLLFVAIDIIIGPVLGFFVYDENKKSLRFDLFVIVLMQILAFIYGLKTFYEGRPAWIVYDSLNFVIVKNSDIENKDINRAAPNFQSPSFLHPKYVATLAASSPVQKRLLDFTRKQQVNTITRYPIFYTDIENAKMRLKINAFPISMLDQYNNKQRVLSTLSKYPKADAWMGLSAPVRDMVVLINKEKGEVVQIVDLKPW